MSDPKTEHIPTAEEMEADISIDADPLDMIDAIAAGYGSDDGHHLI